MHLKRWRGVVTEDGKHFLPDYPVAFRQCLQQYAGEEVLVTVQRAAAITQNKRAFWHAIIVPEFAEETGEPSLAVAHRLLKRLALCQTADEPTPSTADGEMTDEEMHDAIDRVLAMLAIDFGIYVSDPEPDPVRRLENTRERSA